MSLSLQSVVRTTDDQTTKTKQQNTGKGWQLYSKAAAECPGSITNKQTPPSKINRKEGTFTASWQHFVWAHQEKSSNQQVTLKLPGRRNTVSLKSPCFNMHLCIMAVLSACTFEEGIRSQGTTVIDGCELPCRCWDLNSGPEEQPVLLSHLSSPINMHSNLVFLVL